MLASLLATAWAGEVQLLHATGAAGDGRQDVATGDFDGDGVIDVAFPFAVGTREGGVAIWLGGPDALVRLELVEPVPEITLTAADWDQDGRIGLLVGVPDDESFGSPSGAVFLIDNVNVGMDGRELAGAASNVWIGPDGSRFGASIAAIEIDGEEGLDLVVGAPAGLGAVYVFPNSNGTVNDTDDADATWLGNAAVGGLGSTLAVLDDLIVVGATDAVAWFARGDALSTQGLDQAVGQIEGVGTASDIEPVGSLGFVLVAGQKLGRVELESTTATTGTVLTWTTEVDEAAAAAQGDLFVRAQDAVHVIAADAPEGAAVDASLDVYDMSLETLFASTDHDGDGCADVVGTDTKDGSVYLLLATCVTDSGDSGDSGDSSDTGVPESGQPDSGGPVDSGGNDSGDADDSAAPDVCVPFGWSCQGGGAPGAAAIAVGLLLSLRRRREAEATRQTGSGDPG